MKIDFTKLGHDENIAHDIAHKDEWLAQKYPEAHIDGDLPPLEQEPIPDWLPPIEPKRSLLSYFKLLLV